jgi:ABC-2 type transport system permease protein
VFYPVSVLPMFLQKIAWFIPATHVFEGMRSVIRKQGLPIEHLLWAFGLNAVYLLAAVLLFYHIFTIVRQKGLLLRVGE